MDASTVEVLKGLEEDMWRAETRFDRDWMERHITEDFLEFGRSGRVYDKRLVLEPASGVIDVDLPLPDFRAVELAPGVVLVTYRSIRRHDDGELEHANRASLWIRAGDGWRMRFHQGTQRGDLPEG